MARPRRPGGELRRVNLYLTLEELAQLNLFCRVDGRTQSSVVARLLRIAVEASVNRASMTDVSLTRRGADGNFHSEAWMVPSEGQVLASTDDWENTMNVLLSKHVGSLYRWAIRGSILQMADLIRKEMDHVDK